jgi:hypothetical protein
MYYASAWEINRHLLQIPLMADFSWKITDNIRWHLAAGPSVSFSLGQTWTTPYINNGYGYGGYYGYEYEQAYTDGSYYKYKGSNDENTVEWGAGVQTGLEIGNWVINAGFDITFPEEYDDINLNRRDHTFSLMAGYKFRLGRK